MRPVFDTGRSYGAFDVSTIDPTVLVELVKSTTAITTAGIQTAAQLAAAKREKAAKKQKAASAPAPAPVVVAAAPRSAVPGWAIGLGAVAVAGVVGLILFMPKKSAHVRTP